jgi:hypothetical protein
MNWFFSPARIIVCAISEQTLTLPGPPADEAMLIDWLRDRDAACPLCGYNLRALQVPRCPECGQALRLSVALAEQYLKAWITLLVFSCLGASVGFLMWIGVLTSGLPPGTIPRVGVCVLLVSTPLPPIVLFIRRRFLKLSQAVQWCWAGPVAGLIVLGFGCFLTLV